MRRKAEAALSQHKALVQNLQTQLAQLQEEKQRASSIREIISVLPQPAIPEPAALQSLQDTSDAAPVFTTQNGRKVELIHYLKVIFLMRTPPFHGLIVFACFSNGLQVGARGGDHKLELDAYNGVRKGLYVAVGKGAAAEPHRVARMGSIILSTPVHHDHAAGTPVIFFLPTESGLARMKRYIAKNFVKSLLDEIVSDAVATGERHIAKEKLDNILSQRPVLKHTYTVVPERMWSPRSGTITAASFISESQQLVVAQGGSLAVYNSRFGAVEMLLLFELLLIQASDDFEQVESVNSIDLQRAVDADPCLSGVFQAACEKLSISSLVEVLKSIQDSNGQISWDKYCSIFQQRSTSRARATADVSMSVRQSSSADKEVDLLKKLFVLIDSDADSLLTLPEAFGVFAEMDGNAVDNEIFQRAVDMVAGSTMTLKLSLPLFVAVRERYAELVGTCSGGFRCYAVWILKSICKKLSLFHGNIDIFSVAEVRTYLPPSMLNAIVLPLEAQFSALLDEVPSHLSCDQLVQLVTGSCSMAGRPGFINQITHQKTKIVQFLTDTRHNCMYALSSDGVIHGYDLLSHELMWQQRVIWSEPLPSRAVEGCEKFYSWRKSSGLDSSLLETDGNSIKVEDVETVSTNLASLVFSLPDEVSSSVIAADEETGLIAVNCSIVSGAICFHEPGTMKRLYRVRVSLRLSESVASAVQSLACGLSHERHLTHQDVHGVISKMILWTKKCLLLCTIVGSNNIHAFSLLTGEPIIELEGHLGPLTCIEKIGAEDMLMSGSADCTVRVWKASNCIPHRLAVAGGLDDPTFAQLEKRICGTSMGVASRKAVLALAEELLARIPIEAKWRRGIVTGFFHADQYHEQYSETVTAIEVPTTQLTNIDIVSVCFVICSSFRLFSGCA